MTIDGNTVVSKGHCVKTGTLFTEWVDPRDNTLNVVMWSTPATRKMFERRPTISDVSFVREHGLYSFNPTGI